ncbi:hypothetical protein [Streptomyces xiamenensis]|uniref:hypothetical protein n=1 Tax=Streptomyces xiamenensis TaxID=408015 RepID=UPI0037D67328
MGNEGRSRRVYEDAVEYLCRNADALRELVGAGGWEIPYAVVRAGDPSTAEWRDAVRQLDRAAEAAGVPGGLGLGTLMGVGDWPSAPVPRSVGWVCPAERCARVELRESTVQDAPGCALSDRPMRLVGD